MDWSLYVMSDTGKLQVSVTRGNSLIPIPDATVEISKTGSDGTVIEQLITDSSGQTETISLEAPPEEYSEKPSEQKPYSEYNVHVFAPGYQDVEVSGTEILPVVEALQRVELVPIGSDSRVERSIVIPDHSLYGSYPDKLPEEEIKPIEDTGEIVLSRVVIPEYVIVHDGVPANSAAPNYYIKYKDYIKNVASSEIYATWPESTIYANVLVIMSFTLNRVYTEWYRGKGYPFTITSSTAYDQKFIYGRNIYKNISNVVDSIFANYLSRPGVKQPIFTSYCNGTTSTCAGLSQWGSKELGSRGYSPINIIRYYYGSDMYINSASSISGVPSSYPGYNLKNGSSGEKVRQMQSQLSRISRSYPAIPTVSADGIFGSKTEQAVKAFQRIFGLPANGIVDYPTWYEISSVYVGVSRIAEPR